MPKRLLPLLLTALLSASAYASAPPANEARAPASTSEDVQALAEAVDLIRTKAGAHRLILLGEMHGTREAPKLLAALATAYAQQGPVLIGLELESSLQPAVDEFMASEGGEDARKKLLAAPEWHVPRARNDGRRNLEVISLLRYLRELKAQVRDVDVLMFDNPKGGGFDPANRDPDMAGRIRAAFAKLPEGRMLTLSGGVHAWLQKRPLTDGFQEPMGSFLRDLDPYSVDIAARGGEFWACIERVCGPFEQRAGSRQSHEPGDRVNDLRVVLPRFTVARLIAE